MPILRKTTLAPVLVGLSLTALLACSAKGPPVPAVPNSVLPKFNLKGVFFFQPGAAVYRRSLRGEVVLETSYADPRRGHFKMRLVGRKRSGAIRVRSYQGRAYLRPDGGLLELFGRQCFEFGKRDWSDRLTPLKSWTCDHLVFQFRTDELTKGVLRGVKSDRTRGSNWLGDFDLVRLPRGLKPVFAGQVLGETATGETVVWGYEAGKKTRDGTPLRLLDGFGRQIGRLRIKSRPGDFLLCTAEGGAVRSGRVAYTMEKIKRPGLFD